MQTRPSRWSLWLSLGLLSACADITRPGTSDDEASTDETSTDADDRSNDLEGDAPDVRDIGRDAAAEDVQGDSLTDTGVTSDVSADAPDALQDTDSDNDDPLDDVSADVSDRDADDTVSDGLDSDTGDVSSPGDITDAADIADDTALDTDTIEPDGGIVCGGGASPGRWYPDTDGDTYGDAAVTPTVACEAPAGFVAEATDCDDTDSMLPSPGTLSAPFIGALRVPPAGTAGTTTLNIAIDSAGLFSSMTIAVRLQHTDTGDLTLTLISPSGTRVQLARRRGFDDDFAGTVFSDGATAAIGSGSNPFTGTWRPEQPLSTFLNEPVNGDWQLEIEDAFSIESGTLQAVTLNFELRCPER